MCATNLGRRTTSRGGPTSPIAWTTNDEIHISQRRPGSCRPWRGSLQSDHQLCKPRRYNRRVDYRDWRFVEAKVGWFDLAAKTYKQIAVSEQREVLSLIGDLAEGAMVTRTSIYMRCSV